jgi:hypothetical protein
MTAPKPRAILWGACERCRGGGEPSPVDDRFCALCWPSLEDLRHRQKLTDRRLALASRAAAQSAESELASAPLRAVPPDAEHIWLSSRAWGAPHLFADGETESRCGKVAVLRRVRADLDTPAPEAVQGCRACWRSYRRGRRGS